MSTNVFRCGRNIWTSDDYLHKGQWVIWLVLQYKKLRGMQKKLHTEKRFSLHQILLRHSTTEQEMSGPVKKWAVEK